jgi:hypothetical protein
MITFIKTLKDIFKPVTYGSRLENYILSKNPTNHSQIEQAAREFERLHLIRGL